MNTDDRAATRSMAPWPGLVGLGRRLPLQDGSGSLFYYDSGNLPSQRATLILIHGLGDEADSWRHLFPLLASSFRLLAPDLPGFGRSVARGGAGIGRCVRAVGELARAEGVGEAVLVGSSLGAAIAQRVASEFPALAAGLVLVDGGWPISPNGGNAGLLSMILPFRGKRRYSAYRLDHAAALRSLEPYYADFARLPEEDQDFLRRRVVDRVESDGQRRAYLSLLRSAVFWTLCRAGSFKRYLAVYPRPILLVWGSEDRILPRRGLELLRAIAPTARSLILEGAGHLPQQEAPQELARALEAFVAAAGMGPGAGL